MSSKKSASKKSPSKKSASKEKKDEKLVTLDMEEMETTIHTQSHIETAKFCKNDDTLLEETEQNGKLVFKCPKDGQIYEATPEQSRIGTEDYEASESSAKFENVINFAAYDQTIPWVANECPDCSRKLVKMLRLGEKKKVVYVCLCGNKRHN